jgi:hypothetical protein
MSNDKLWCELTWAFSVKGFINLPRDKQDKKTYCLMEECSPTGIYCLIVIVPEARVMQFGFRFASIERTARDARFQIAL